jgi:S-adenosylmethionine-diacylgycerolhomoserine-N-methlytransferase
MTHSESLQRYYAFNASLYDCTRWSFLFGRARLVQEVKHRLQPAHILEIGCGTGANLAQLGRLFPAAQLTGIDTSAEMLLIAERKLRGLGNQVNLREGYYRAPLGLRPAPDLICFSYCLSMMDSGVGEAIAAAAFDLAPGGRLAVVDFHGSRHPWFRRWMRLNHVRMEEHVLPLLRSRFHGEWVHLGGAYGGLWRYFLFLGQFRSAGEVGQPVGQLNLPRRGIDGGLVTEAGVR